MVSKLHVKVRSTDFEATLPASVLERLGIRDGGDVDLVFRDQCLVVRRRGDERNIEEIADEIMDHYEDVFRALS